LLNIYFTVTLSKSNYFEPLSPKPPRPPIIADARLKVAHTQPRIAHTRRKVGHTQHRIAHARRKVAHTQHRIARTVTPLSKFSNQIPSLLYSWRLQKND